MKFSLVPTLLTPLLLSLPLQGCTPSGTDAATGARVFRQCASCHQVGANARAGFGPQLNGLFGRRAGSAPDFVYSEAMRRSGIVWDERTLAAFVRAPDKVVPETKMRFWGLGDENQIQALLAYLRSFQDADRPAAPR
ncbi:MAG: c-type cytochrome [Ramlibacter sp.]